MANYYLATLDLNELLYSDSKNKNKLENIDRFTTLFENEEELKLYLLKKEIIELKDVKKKLCIYYKYRNNNKKVMYGLSYKKDKKFFDVEYLKYHILSKSQDIQFLEKLCNHYRNSYIQGSNINAIRFYINRMKANEFISNKDMIFYQERIVDFIYREVYDYDSKTFNYKYEKNGKLKIKYKTLHDLAMFTSFNNKEKIKTKTKTKQKDGQLNFFDLGYIK